MLLSYEEFQERVMNEFIDFLPEKYSDCTLQLIQIPNQNNVLTCITIKPQNAIEYYVPPVFSVEKLYSHYEECCSLEKTMEDQAVYLEESNCFITKNILSLYFSRLREKTVFQIINSTV